MTACASWTWPVWSRATKFHDGSLGPGDAFHLDLDGTVIAGRYIKVDPPHRLVIGWDHERTDKATPTPALIEITLTPTGDGTNVKVQLSGLSAVDAAFYRQLWARHLDRIAAVFAGTEPGALPGN